MIESDLQKNNIIKFSKEEDIILIQLVKMLGIKNWRDIDKYYSKISKETKRDQKQLKSRWINYLEINCKKLNWDIVEEYIFFEFRTKLGNRWSPIAKVIPSKSDNDVKNHFHSNLKKMFRRLMKKKFDINCIYEKIRAFYFMNYIKSKYENFVHYYDSLNNSINFDAIKENTELITNVDDKAICDLVIDQKGSIKIVNNTLNEVCLMIISDPLSVQLIEKLDEKYLTKNIRNIRLFNFEEKESQILINMIIKLHVFYNLKNFERRGELENKNSNKMNEDTSHLKTNNSHQEESRKKKSKLKILKDFGEESKDNETKGCEEKKNTLCYKDSEQKIFINNLEELYSKGNVNMNEKCYIINKEKDNLLKDLTSNNFMEYNLGNFNRREGIKTELIKNYSKDDNNQTQNTKNLYNMKEINVSESIENQKNLNSTKFFNIPVKNIDGFSKEQANKQSMKNLVVLNQNSKSQNNGKIINTLNLNKNFGKSMVFENQNIHNGFEITSSHTKIMEKVEYGEIIERFFESDELRCLLDERNLLDLQEGWNKKVNKEINNSNQLESLDSKYKKKFIEKLSDFQNAEFNQSIKIRDYNKIIKIERKIDTNKEILPSINAENEIESKNLSNFKINKSKNINNFVNKISYFPNNNEHKDLLQRNIIDKNFDKEKIEKINNQIILSKQKINYRLKKSELSKKSLLNISLLKNDIKDEEKKKEQNLSVKLFNNIFDCQKINGNKLKGVINDPTNCTIDFVYKKEEIQSSPKISICDDLKEKYPSVEEENLLNTNYCYISNSLLDKLMNLHDPDFFLKIIEKIVVNNIVYSMFNKEKYSISSNLKFNNKNLAYIYTNRENDEYNIIKNKNAYPSKCFVDNSNNFIKIKSYKIDPDLKIYSSNLDDENFYNIYNRIKNLHNISKNKIENSINEMKNLNNHLDLQENVSYKIKMNNSKQNVCDIKDNRMMMDTMNNSLDDNSINYIRNVNGFPNNKIFDFLLKNTICNLENEKMEENCNMENLNSYKIVLNKNFCLKSNFMDNFNAMYETNSERFTNSTFKNLEINNFNFQYDSKMTLLRRKKRAEY